MRLEGRGAPVRPIAVLPVLLLLAAAMPARAAAPERIVSMDLCLDQLVLLLADRDRIAAVSHLAADPAVSAVAGRATGVPLHHGHAEEIIPLAPDLVLAGRYGGRQAAALLARLGYRVVEVEEAHTVDDIPARVRRVAALVGAPERGERLLARFAARLHAVRPRGDEARPLAALYNPNGVTAGVGTVPNAVLELAGFETLARREGLHGAAVIPLERLLVSRPDVLVTGYLPTGTPSLATALLDHPALRRAFPDARTIAVPERYWICAGPAIADAADILAAARRALDGPSPRPRLGGRGRLRGSRLGEAGASLRRSRVGRAGGR